MAPLNSMLTDELDTIVVADFDGNGLSDVAQASSIIASKPPGNPPGASTWYYHHTWRVAWDGTGPWRPLRDFVADPSGLLTTHFIGSFDASPGADALSYRPDGNDFIRSSGARSDYVTHSWNGMR